MDDPRPDNSTDRPSDAAWDEHEPWRPEVDARRYACDDDALRWFYGGSEPPDLAERGAGDVAA